VRWPTEEVVVAVGKVVREIHQLTWVRNNLPEALADKVARVIRPTSMSDFRKLGAVVAAGKAVLVIRQPTLAPHSLPEALADRVVPVIRLGQLFLLMQLHRDSNH
jgi:hypothetical protein